MKKLLFWLATPISLTLFAAASLLGSLCEGCTECCHKWEGWCFDYKKKFPELHYKGEGIWSGFKEDV